MGQAAGIMNLPVDIPRDAVLMSGWPTPDLVSDTSYCVAVHTGTLQYPSLGHEGPVMIRSAARNDPAAGTAILTREAAVHRYLQQQHMRSDRGGSGGGHVVRLLGEIHSRDLLQPTFAFDGLAFEAWDCDMGTLLGTLSTTDAELFDRMQLPGTKDLIACMRMQSAPSSIDKLLIGGVVDFLSGLQYMHRHNVFHNNLGPRSMLCRRKWAGVGTIEVAVGDLSMATHRTWRDDDQSVVYAPPNATPWNAPPRSDEPYGVARDVYGVGVVLTCVICRRPNLSVADTMVRDAQTALRSRAPSSRVPNVTDRLLRLIGDCLEVERNARPSLGAVLERVGSIWSDLD
jgi:hypothetical protein